MYICGGRRPPAGDHQGGGGLVVVSVALSRRSINTNEACLLVWVWSGVYGEPVLILVLVLRLISSHLALRPACLSLPPAPPSPRHVTTPRTTTHRTTSGPKAHVGAARQGACEYGVRESII